MEGEKGKMVKWWTTQNHRTAKMGIGFCTKRVLVQGNTVCYMCFQFQLLSHYTIGGLDHRRWKLLTHQPQCLVSQDLQ